MLVQVDLTKQNSPPRRVYFDAGTGSLSTPFFRDLGFGALVPVETAWPSFTGLYLQCHLDAPAACFGLWVARIQRSQSQRHWVICIHKVFACGSDAPAPASNPPAPRAPATLSTAPLPRLLYPAPSTSGFAGQNQPETSGHPCRLVQGRFSNGSH